MASAVYNPNSAQLQQLIAQITRGIPQSRAIPSFEQSGLFDPNAANAQYQAEFQPYYQFQGSALDAQKQAAQEALQRSLGYVGASTGLQTQSAQQQAATQQALLEQERRKGLLGQSGTAAQLGQSGSGVDQRDTGMINQGINTEEQQVQNVLQQQQAQAKQYQDYATGAYNADFQNQYGGPYSAYAQQKQNLSDQNTIGQANYGNQLKQEAYQRFLQRYQNQPSY